jgi:CheY-like chemotaxis protein
MLTGTRVLVVDDEAIIVMLIEAILEGLECKVVGTATFFQDALEKARSLPIDVALLDVNLAGEMSYPVAEVLQSRNIPFAFVTGYGAVTFPSGLRVAPVLAKPFKPDQLVKILRDTITGANARIQSEH